MLQIHRLPGNIKMIKTTYSFSPYIKPLSRTQSRKKVFLLLLLYGGFDWFFLVFGSDWKFAIHPPSTDG